jgi:site-specific DNA recombinase
MNEAQQKKAVIYARVSSAQQTTRTDGLSSQEQRCRLYCEHKGYEVVEIFKDDMSGSVAKRPGMDAMLSYLRKTRKHSHVVVIDDISRLARGIEAHIQLRAEIGSTGASLESPSIEFGEDSDSKLVENLLACVSQHARQKNAEQTLNRMMARVERGFWAFQAPWGYRYGQCPTGGKMLHRHEPVASILKEALEGFAHGRFASQSEVMRFLESQPAIPKQRDGTITVERVHQILTQPLYAGIVTVPNWNITPRMGHHEPLVSVETYNTVQEKLNETPRAPARADLNDAFPLRGFVCCASCEQPMTANWSKGKSGHYAYYLCRHKGCSDYAKSVPRAQIEDAFDAMLKGLTPARQLVDLATDAFRNLWNRQMLKAGETKKSITEELGSIDKKVTQLLDRIVEADSAAVIQAYERRIAELESRKLLLREQMLTCDKPVKDFDESFRTALQFLASPWNLWKSDKLTDKRMALKLTFPSQLAYDRKTGFRTPILAMPFNMLGDISMLENGMAHRPRNGSCRFWTPMVQKLWIDPEQKEREQPMPRALRYND